MEITERNCIWEIGGTAIEMEKEQSMEVMERVHCMLVVGRMVLGMDLEVNSVVIVCILENGRMV